MTQPCCARMALPCGTLCDKPSHPKPPRSDGSCPVRPPSGRTDLPKRSRAEPCSPTALIGSCLICRQSMPDRVVPGHCRATNLPSPRSRRAAPLPNDEACPVIAKRQADPRLPYPCPSVRLLHPRPARTKRRSRPGLSEPDRLYYPSRAVSCRLLSPAPASPSPRDVPGRRTPFPAPPSTTQPGPRRSPSAPRCPERQPGPTLATPSDCPGHPCPCRARRRTSPMHAMPAPATSHSGSMPSSPVHRDEPFPARPSQSAPRRRAFAHPPEPRRLSRPCPARPQPAFTTTLCGSGRLNATTRAQPCLPARLPGPLQATPPRPVTPRSGQAAARRCRLVSSSPALAATVRVSATDLCSPGLLSATILVAPRRTCPALAFPSDFGSPRQARATAHASPIQSDWPSLSLP
jgi:hypothetical protein